MDSAESSVSTGGAGGGTRSSAAAAAGACPAACSTAWFDHGQSRDQQEQEEASTAASVGRGGDDSNSNNEKSQIARGGVATPFPWRLHEMLEAVEREGLQHIVSWLPHGRAFVVLDTKAFVGQVLRRFFTQSKYPSFQRQLNLYGFSRFAHGRDKGAYYHECFIRGDPTLIRGMVRTKIKGTKIRRPLSAEEEPNFYKHSTSPVTGGGGRSLYASSEGGSASGAVVSDHESLSSDAVNGTAAAAASFLAAASKNGVAGLSFPKVIHTGDGGPRLASCAVAPTPRGQQFPITASADGGIIGAGYCNGKGTGGDGGTTFSLIKSFDDIQIPQSTCEQDEEEDDYCFDIMEPRPIKEVTEVIGPTRTVVPKPDDLSLLQEFASLVHNRIPIEDHDQPEHAGRGANFNINPHQELDLNPFSPSFPGADDSTNHHGYDYSLPLSPQCTLPPDSWGLHPAPPF